MEMQKHKFPYNWRLSEAKFTKDKGKVFSCFACGGGSTMGYKLAGFDVIGCNEIDPKMMKCYIENPAMYKMGYNNNNCIGCVKGGMGYWNKIRKDFPNVFDRMAKIEREVGATCLKDQSGKIFLDELSPNRGEMPEEMIPDCSLICQIEFQELLDRQVERVLKGEISINDVV